MIVVTLLSSSSVSGIDLSRHFKSACPISMIIQTQFTSSKFTVISEVMPLVMSDNSFCFWADLFSFHFSADSSTSSSLRIWGLKVYSGSHSFLWASEKYSFLGFAFL